MRNLRIFIMAGVVACAGVNFQAAAAHFAVKNNLDSGPGSLREAILNANAQGGVIVFSPRAAGTIQLQSPLPAFTANITVAGPGKHKLIVSGSGLYPVFSMNAGTTNTVSRLTIADGFSVGFPYYPYFTVASGISNAGALRMMDCVVSNCASSLSLGVGVYNAGDLTLRRCVVTDCHDPFGSTTLGAGIYNNGVLNIANSSISDCTSGSDGAGGGGIYNRGTLTMSKSAILDCAAERECDGGGILNEANAILNMCVVSNCSAFWGGGIRTLGELCMTNCSVLNNEADEAGGIMSSGTTFLDGCTVAGNISDFVGGSLDNFGDMQLYNCTVSDNQMIGPAVLAAYGSGISDGFVNGESEPSTLLLCHCTVVSNSGPVEIYTANAITADESILGACNGTLASSAGHNLFLSTGGCVFAGNLAGDLYNVDPHLGPLADNGGPTLTHALLTGSPAINAADPGDTSSADERGVQRPQGPASDIGAFEFVPPSVPLTTTAHHKR